MLALFFVLWVVLNGRITVEILAFGLAVSAGTGFFMHRLIGWSMAEEWKILRNLPLLCLYILVLIREIIKAALTVMKLAVSRQEKPDPVIVEFHSGYASGFRNVLLANSITLTPGTITMDVAEDEQGNPAYYVQWIDVAETDREKAGEIIKGRMERAIARIWGEKPGKEADR